MHRFPGKYLTGFGLSLGLLAACQAGTAPADQPSAKISPQLMQAAHAVMQGSPTSAHTDAQGRLQVYVYVTDLSPDTLAKLDRSGLVEPQGNPQMSVVQGWIPPRDLDALAALDCVKNVTLPRYVSPR
ncbi:MAG TPA: hypothetical protein VGH71_09060 [Gammaproteobacteria bacterium]|jgi:hypothetical protein